MPDQLGRRERRRARLRRRARDRDVRASMDLTPCVFARHADPRSPAWRGEGWWSTAEGRRAWTDGDMSRKAARSSLFRPMSGEREDYFDDRDDPDIRDLDEYNLAVRVGAARAGRLLYGREHLDSPWGPLET